MSRLAVLIPVLAGATCLLCGGWQVLTDAPPSPPSASAFSTQRFAGQSTDTHAEPTPAESTRDASNYTKIPDAKQAASGRPGAGLSERILRRLCSRNAAKRATVFDELLPALLATDPNAAASLIETLTPETGRDEVLQQVARGLGNQFPDQALAWANGLSAPPEREAALTAIILQISQSDPSRAMSAAEQFTTVDGNRTVITDVLQSWANNDLTGALSWVNGQSAGTGRDEMMGRIAFMESRTDPEQASQLIAAQIQDATVLEDATISVLHQWARQDFDAATAWVARFPLGSIRERALDELAGYRRYQLLPIKYSDSPIP